MTVVATLAIWLGVGGRIIVGFLNPEALAAYGVAFRVAGFALGVHQLAVTALFARLYAARTKVADPMIAGFFMVSTFAATLAIAATAARPEADFRPVGRRRGPGTGRSCRRTARHTFHRIDHGMLQCQVGRSGLAKPGHPSHGRRYPRRHRDHLRGLALRYERHRNAGLADLRPRRRVLLQERLAARATRTRRTAEPRWRGLAGSALLVAAAAAV